MYNIHSKQKPWKLVNGNISVWFLWSSDKSCHLYEHDIQRNVYVYLDGVYVVL